VGKDSARANQRAARAFLYLPLGGFPAADSVRPANLDRFGPGQICKARLTAVSFGNRGGRRAVSRAGHRPICASA